MGSLDGLYEQNPAYSAGKDGLFWVLMDAEGLVVAIDDVVYTAGAAFDTRLTGYVIEALTTEAEMAFSFVGSAAKVLARAVLEQSDC